MKKYKQPDQPITKFNPEAKQAIPPPLEELDAHDLETTHFSMDEKRLISCAKDGTVQIRSFENFGTPKTFVVQGWRNANLTFCCLSQDDGLFFTCGKDGAVAMWKDKDIQIKGSD